MANSKKTFGIALQVEVAEMIKNLYNGKDRRRYKNRSQAVNDLLKTYYGVMETIDGQYYHLSVRAIGTDLIEICDNLRDIVAEIIVGYDQKIKKHRLYCRLDNSFNCEHVGYAVVCPQVRHLQEIGKLPKEKITSKKSHSEVMLSL